MRRRIGSVCTGAGVALLPLIAAAQSPAGSRATDAPGDMGQTILFTFLALGGIFIAAVVGYLYRQKRSLHWSFQDADEPHDEHH